MKIVQVHLENLEVGHVVVTDESGRKLNAGYRIESDPLNERFLVQVDFAVSFSDAKHAALTQ